MRWRRHSERPRVDEPIPALVATLDETDGDVYLVGIFIWRAGRWEDEITGSPLRYANYWWVPESELIAEVPK